MTPAVQTEPVSIVARVRSRVAVVIDGHVPVMLAPEEASDLAAILWRAGERHNTRGAISLSIALLDAKRGGAPVAVVPSQLPALRDALARLARRDEQRFASLARAAG